MITSTMKMVKTLESSFARSNCKVLVILGSVFVISLVVTVVTQHEINHNNNKSGNNNHLVLLSTPGDLTILGLEEEPQERINIFQARDEGEDGSNPPVVRIRGQGRVRGRVLKSRKNRDYEAFYQIPYARPPVGRLRFEPPQSPRRWFGTRDGTQPGVECVQKEKYSPMNISAGEEDCLHLNVYRPKLPETSETKLLPVMFYIHGGGVYGNGTRYGAKYFMDEDVILITFEFRLGFLGHFTTGTSDYPGNIGGRDRVMALKWVQEHIEAFGGDPKRVLIFGNSSGARAVHELMLSPMSAGLFSKAIVQSGTTLPPANILKDPISNVKNFTEQVGCGRYWNTSTRRLLRCLRRVDAKEMVLNPLQTYFDGITIESYQESGDDSDVYMPDTPWNIMQNGRSHKVPAIIGVNSLEALPNMLLDTLLEPNGTQIIESNWDDIVPAVVGVPDDANHTMASEFYDIYIGDEEGVTKDSALGLWNMSVDDVMHSSRISGLLHRNTTGAPVYFYWLSKEPPKSYGDSVKSAFPTIHGAFHADELQYMFLYYGYPEVTLDSPWFQFSEALVKLWTSFASTGQPTLPNVSWEPIDLADNGMKWFQLDDEMKVIEDFTSRMEAWDDLIPQLYAVNSTL